MFLIFVVVCCYFGLPFIHAGISNKIIKNKTVKSSAIVLTFDDGPGEKLTLELLNMLSQNCVKATFFLLGRNIQGKEEIVKQIAEQGHEICSHGYDHLHYRRISPFKALADIKHGWEAINTALGTKKNKYPFRPPYGDLDFLSLMYLLVCRVPIIYWSIDSGDTWQKRPDIEKITLLLKENGGGVCLIHDFERKIDDNRKYVLDVTKSIINKARENNISLLTASELFSKSPKVKRADEK